MDDRLKEFLEFVAAELADPKFYDLISTIDELGLDLSSYDYNGYEDYKDSEDYDADVAEYAEIFRKFI